ncbi:MAG: Unknown protein [uncultured Sulfurovum sp.]|uniref:Outer membrane protein beta-barrel domain-containing protein n=1 Tax=uncultured Sulfurovum sp. TaxID=269237 RepID=A0A6S6SLI7_9BACT|nr:MAG: Unknown protein [uncultured Sulfurovum sp.]
MKKIIALSICSISLFPIHANATELFVGMEQSHKKTNNKTYVNNKMDKHNKSLNISSLKLGLFNGDKQTGDRYEFIYNFGDEDIVSSLDLVDVAIQYNYTLPSLLNSELYLPYLRLGISYSRVSENDPKSQENPKYDAYGYILGLGTYYSFTKNLEFSLGFDYGYKKWNDITLYQGTVNVFAKEKIQKSYIGFNYLF